MRSKYQAKAFIGFGVQTEKVLEIEGNQKIVRAKVREWIETEAKPGIRVHILIEGRNNLFEQIETQVEIYKGRKSITHNGIDFRV